MSSLLGPIERSFSSIRPTRHFFCLKTDAHGFKIQGSLMVSFSRILGMGINDVVKNHKGEWPIFGFYCIFISKFTSREGGGGSVYTPTPLFCASMYSLETPECIVVEGPINLRNLFFQKKSFKMFFVCLFGSTKWWVCLHLDHASN